MELRADSQSERYIPLSVGVPPAFGPSERAERSSRVNKKLVECNQMRPLVVPVCGLLLKSVVLDRAGDPHHVCGMKYTNKRLSSFSLSLSPFITSLPPLSL